MASKEALLGAVAHVLEQWQSGDMPDEHIFQRQLSQLQHLLEREVDATSQADTSADQDASGMGPWMAFTIAAEGSTWGDQDERSLNRMGSTAAAEFSFDMSEHESSATWQHWKAEAERLQAKLRGAEGAMAMQGKALADLTNQ